MNKRNTIIVVFRVIAIFLFFSLLSNLPTSINNLAYVNVVDPLSPSPLFKIVRFIVMLAFPFAFSIILWNKSGWVADKILKPLEMDELWDDPEADESAHKEQPELISTHLDRDEIELVVFTAIGVWVLATSIPELFRFSFSIFLSEHLFLPEIISLAIIPFTKTIIGAWLLLRSGMLMTWLKRWRELRMQD